MSVAYLGPAGHLHRRGHAGLGAGEIEPRPRSTVYETVMAVQEAETDRAVVPIENSLEGGVAATLDALAGEADRVRIAAEVVHPDPPLPRRRAACSARPRSTRVLSHPQATGAVRPLPARAPARRRARGRHLHRRGGAHRARLAASRGPRSARGSPAELYECEVLAERVEDHPDNLTRFVWLAPAGTRGAARSRARQDLDRLLGLQRLLARRAGVRAARALRTATST